MYLTERGARSLGQGARYAAPDDGGALFSNPAGLAFTKDQWFMDGTVTFMQGEYTRVDSGGNVQPTTEVDATPLPIPMFAYVDDFGFEDFTFGAGFAVPNIVPLGYQTTDATKPEPQRYSILSMDGSAFGHMMIGAAWTPVENLSLGLTAQLVTGLFVSEVALSACDGTLCVTPENEEYDSVTQFSLLFAAPTASLGVSYDLGWARVGTAFTLPHTISGDANMKTRLPSAPAFRNARVDGDTAEMTLKMPWIWRSGVEFRPTENIRAEVAFAIEGWSVQDRLSVTPKNVWLRDMIGIGDMELGGQDIPRNMKNVYSVSVGGAYDITESFGITAGANYQTDAFEDDYFSALTLDSEKLVVGVGVNVQVVEDVFLDASYGHVFMADREVTNSQVQQANPVRPAYPDDVFVGNGSYEMEADTIGLGLRWLTE